MDKGVEEKSKRSKEECRVERKRVGERSREKMGSGGVKVRVQGGGAA